MIIHRQEMHFLVDFFKFFFATAECNIPLFDSEGEAVVNHK